MGIIGDTDMQYGWLKSKSWRDFIGGYPVLLDNKKKCSYDYAAEINYKARRTAIGYNDDTIFIVCVESPGMAFPALQDLMLAIGCNYAINLDGGGSTKMLHNGKSVTKDITDRAVDNVVAIYLKNDASKIPTENIDITYQVYSSGKWWDAVKNYNTTNSNGYAGVETSPIQGLKALLSKGSIQYRAHITSGMWLPWVTDNSDYAGIIGQNGDKNCCFKGRYRVTSPRGYRGLEFHKGIDLVGIDDTTVYSICDGTVGTGYEANGAGYYIVVTMADGRRVYYMHLKTNSFKVQNGDKVKKGQALGIMGSTGNSTGAHTHLELRPAGVTMDSLDICEFTGIINKVGVYGGGETIDGIQARLIGDVAKTHEIKYRVSTINSISYLPWVKGDSDYAGIFGRGIDKVQMIVEKK
jgi:murein DD-endopeptidase MepM/ murein hydrolase activator NlpD